MNRGYLSTPPVVKNLLIINTLVFMVTALLPIGHLIDYKCALYFVSSQYFEPYQFFTYMFLHASFGHLFFNMFALWMFGRVLEVDLGSRRFLTFYVVCGIGAAVIQQLVNWGEMSYMASSAILNTPTVGASGAVFGILLGFGLLHPNSMIMLLIPPMPIRAKYFVIVYGALELFLGVYNPGSSIAHFAHLGGMLWGYMLLRYWKSRKELFY